MRTYVHIYSLLMPIGQDVSIRRMINASRDLSYWYWSRSAPVMVCTGKGLQQSRSAPVKVSTGQVLHRQGLHGSRTAPVKICTGRGQHGASLHQFRSALVEICTGQGLHNSMSVRVPTLYNFLVHQQE